MKFLNNDNNIIEISFQKEVDDLIGLYQELKQKDEIKDEKIKKLEEKVNSILNEMKKKDKEIESLNEKIMKICDYLKFEPEKFKQNNIVQMNNNDENNEFCLIKLDDNETLNKNEGNNLDIQNHKSIESIKSNNINDQKINSVNQNQINKELNNVENQNAGEIEKDKNSQNKEAIKLSNIENEQNQNENDSKKIDNDKNNHIIEEVNQNQENIEQDPNNKNKINEDILIQENNDQKQLDNNIEISTNNPKPIEQINNIENNQDKEENKNKLEALDNKNQTNYKQIKQNNEENKENIQDPNYLSNQNNNLNNTNSNFKNIIEHSKILNEKDINFLLTYLANDKIIKDLELLYDSKKEEEDEEKLLNIYTEKEDLIFLVKTTESRKFGGYAHEKFKKEEFIQKDKKAFLFNLDKKKIYKSKGKSFSIWRGSNTKDSINFGTGTDLKIYHRYKSQDSKTFQTNNDYDYDSKDERLALNGNESFQIENLEIYKVLFN